MKSGLILSTIFCIITNALNAQEYNRSDSLRGALNEYRSNYDVINYDLDLAVNFSLHSISGHNKIRFDVLKNLNKIQLDLFANMNIDSILYDGIKIDFTREANAVFVNFPWRLLEGTTEEVVVYYHGHPIVAVNPPWDGGFSWEKDAKKRDWLGVSCEGIGASLWWPCKDHLSDEPTAMTMSFTVPSQLVAVSNGRLESRKSINRDLTKYTWKVVNPINSYNVTLNVAYYKHIHDEYISVIDQKLDLDYYVIRENYDTAAKHFKQVHDIITVFEKYFGPYAFYNDSYKLVESSYWGMEHQSCIAYGNNFKNNQWDFDFIILHETAHEWFGNSLSMTDHAEMWLHEAFATYAEAIYIEETQDSYESIKYLITKKSSINNDYPMLGDMDVNYQWEDSDIYFKGAWMLHTLRSVINNDDLWFDILYTFCQKHFRSCVTSSDFINLVSKKTGKSFDYFFDHYLGTANVPKLEYKIIRGKKSAYFLEYRWVNVKQGFNMPIQVSYSDGVFEWIQPTTHWQSKSIRKTNASNFRPATHLFLVDFENVK